MVCRVRPGQHLRIVVHVILIGIVVLGAGIRVLGWQASGSHPLTVERRRYPYGSGTILENRAPTSGFRTIIDDGSGTVPKNRT